LCWVFLEMGLTFCPGWAWTTILLISASWLGRITSPSHQCPALLAIFRSSLEKQLFKSFTLLFNRVVWFCLFVCLAIEL
jgi:hypothetical protein